MNFQNLPRADTVVKRAFVPRPGQAFHMFDYMQVEPRFLGYFAAKMGDDSIAGQLRDGADPYTTILRPVYGENMTPEQRHEGKTLFMSLMFGAGKRSVSQQFGISEAAAKRDMIDPFHAALPIVRRLQNGIERTATQRGYIRTPWGRHIHPEPHGEYKMLAHLIQGSAAHLMKRAMCLVDDYLVEQELDTTILMLSQVHDELQFDAPHSQAELLHVIVPSLMGGAAALLPAGESINDVVPILVDHEVAVTDMSDKRSYEDWKGIPY
jgi:DNA polymerase-1